MIYVKPEGPRNAAIMIVGEAPGDTETKEGRPFCGASGYELTNILRDAGIARSECFVTNVVRFQPIGNDIECFITPVKKTGTDRGFVLHNGMWVAPFVREHIEHLETEIREVNPNIIVALGNTPMWALLGKTGITKWRGSQLARTDGRKVIPIIHPAAILREYEQRAIAVHDFKMRVKLESYTPTYQKPIYDFTIRPSFGQTAAFLSALLVEIKATPLFRLVVDIETRRGQIACIGLGTSTRRAFCIPIMCVERAEGYWSFNEELWIVNKLREILTHRNIWGVGQNYIYDSQYIVKQFHFIPQCNQDTMLWHHTLFPGLPKGLDFLASLYADFYIYWKDEGKEWTMKMNEDELWHYNCLDCAYTYEVSLAQEKAAMEMHLC